MNITKKILLILGAFFITPAFSIESSDLNMKILKYSCSNLSSNKETCLNEINYLNKRNDENSIVKLCFENSNTINQLNDCLRYKQNPLIFLKYQGEKNITTLKKIKLTKDISLNCKLKKDNKKCEIEDFSLVKRGENPNNWIENYCLHKNNEINDYKKCINNIKSEAYSENNLIKKIPEIESLLAQMLLKTENKRSPIINAIYQMCYSKYSNENTLICFEDKIKNTNLLNDTTIYNLNCINKKNSVDYIDCLKGKE